MNSIEKITLLRDHLRANAVDALILTGTDPHLSEYPTPEWRDILWLSGFSGSYSRMVITMTKALLWTDSRYFIQAESQLGGSGILLMKDKLTDTISIENWLKNELNAGSRVAVDGLTISGSYRAKLESELRAKGISLIINLSLVSSIWKNRPTTSQLKIVDYPIRFSGQSRSDKLSQIRNKLLNHNADATIISQLDDLAWSFNLRGSEIDYNPLFTGYGYVDNNQAILFVKEGRITSELTSELSNDGIGVESYDSLFSIVAKYCPATIYLDPERTNSIVYSFFSDKYAVIHGIAIPARLKSIKNRIEIAGIKAAHRRDGVAMVNFLHWFQCEKCEKTELSVAQKLKEFRAQQRNYKSESFGSIVGFGPHGAIVHYSATTNTNAVIESNGILLIDSGGQYLDGTTDITRTIGVGITSAKQKKDFTLVLKGMINLSNIVFPVGTKGHSLDIIARKHLWNNYLNYQHGTGHGIGHFLSVHEGPMSIRSESNEESILEGQILSNEPGIYREGEYGIRIENVIVCKKAGSSSYGSFNSFETLTLCPIDKKMILAGLLSQEELLWINNYHRTVLRRLKQYLKPNVLEWLTNACSPI